MKKYAILVDGSNFYQSIKHIGMQFDYRKLLNFFEGDLLRAVYFTAVPEDKTEHNTMRPVMDWLETNGYMLKTKFMKRYLDLETGETRIKGNMDMEMAIEAINLAPFCTDIILCTGDGDFCVLVEHLQTKYGVRVGVISSRETSSGEPRMLSEELRRKADYVYDLSDPRVRGMFNKEAETTKHKFSF